MKSLLIMRHAKSSWENSNLTDFERPLNARGEDDAPRMGRLLRRENLTPDLIISSSAERALQTAELVALACDYDRPLQVTRDLYHASPEQYFITLSEVERSLKRVMVVGHNPGIEVFLSQLILSWTTMTTANIGHVELDLDDWSQIEEGMTGRLIHFWQPKALGR